ncbi:MAG: GIY-YIG nuclease family protein [Bacteroidota bacterium]|nr:GIY-YIG nuclease family protein [Bacteroidota bacterium]
MPYYVYLLESKQDKTLYSGQTDNLIDRFQKHNKKLVRSTKSRAPYDLVYFEVHNTRSEAMWREWEIKKKWNIERKRKLIESFDKSKIIKLFTDGA